MIYHIATRSEWEAAGKLYRTGSLDTEGFIHCSEAAELPGVANDFFRGRDDLVLLAVDPSRVEAEIRYEPAPDRPGMFPHIYGPLETDAVVRAVPLRPAGDGRFDEALAPLVDP